MKEFNKGNLKIIEKEPCSKEGLKVLSKKQIQLKELWMTIIMATKCKNSDIVKVSAWYIQNFKVKK